MHKLRTLVIKTIWKQRKRCRADIPSEGN